MMKNATPDDLTDVPKVDEMLCFSIYSAGHAVAALAVGGFDLGDLRIEAALGDI